MHQEGRGYAALRRGRVSVPEATYFVTVCVHGSDPHLDSPDVILSINSVLTDLEGDGSIVCRASTIMPDHVHLAFALKERLTFSRVISRFKAKTKVALARRGLAWQENLLSLIHISEPTRPY